MSPITRRRARRASPQGFTLVELLVVITIIAMLMAMIFPAAGQVVESARRAKCSKKVGSLAMAANTYASASGELPGLVNRIRRPGSSRDGDVKATWCVMIMNQMDQPAVYESWKAAASSSSSAKGGVAKLIDALVCDSDPATEDQPQKLSYVANAGHARDVASAQFNMANGLFFNCWILVNNPNDPNQQKTRRGFNMDRIRDGKPYTIMFSENIQAWNWADKRTSPRGLPQSDDEIYTDLEAGSWTGMCWGGNQRNINAGARDGLVTEAGPPGDLSYARPSSYHPGGANAAMCDGSVFFMAESTDTETVLAQLMTPDHQNSNARDKTYQLNDRDYK